MTSHTPDNHPSQAEGEDPQQPADGGGSGQTGHPSQAEGEDPDADDSAAGTEPGGQ